ncbi:MAG TPA: ribosome silencing factor, partial [Alphaproteobacteria bacterium]|nr:ribosome silencing factor [Alphaproteobacteria bacterium]
MRLHIQPSATQRLSAQDLCRLVLATLEDMKAEEIVTIDLAGKTEIADYMVIASGTSGRQLVAIAERMAERLKAQALGPVPMEGLEAG